MNHEAAAELNEPRCRSLVRMLCKKVKNKMLEVPQVVVDDPVTFIRVELTDDHVVALCAC